MVSSWIIVVRHHSMLICSPLQKWTRALWRQA